MFRALMNAASHPDLMRDNIRNLVFVFEEPKPSALENIKKLLSRKIIGKRPKNRRKNYGNDQVDEYARKKPTKEYKYYNSE